LRCGAAALVGGSAAVRALKDALPSVALSDVNLLLCGEPGTGKREWAEAIHRKSGRCDGPFVVLAASELTEARVERRLFGDDGREGLLAERGATLYVDAVEALSPRLQQRLAQSLALPGAVSVRIVAGTAVALEEYIRLGRFLHALYRRVGAIQLTIAPLRDRPEDIPAIVEQWLWRASQRAGTPPVGILDGALAELRGQRWAENTRELVQVVEAARNAAGGRPITAETVRIVLARRGRRAAAHDILPLDRLEYEYIRTAVARCGGNQSLAARRLGIGRSTLIRKLRGIPARDTAAA
jgi:DNA-binding NtrC family response regulator